MPDPYRHLSLPVRLQLLVFEAELAHLPRSLIAAIWELSDRFLSMSWKPPEHTDREVRDWMKARGWTVTRLNYDVDREVYAWRHDVRGGPSPTLRISRKVLESYPAFVVLYQLDEPKVAWAMRTQPEVSLAVNRRLAVRPALRSKRSRVQ